MHETLPSGATNYTLQLGLEIPIFSGFSRQYAVSRRARKRMPRWVAPHW